MISCAALTMYSDYTLLLDRSSLRLQKFIEALIKDEVRYARLLEDVGVDEERRLLAHLRGGCG